MSLNIGLPNTGNIIILYFNAIISLAVNNSLPSKEVVLFAPILKGSVLELIELVVIVDFPNFLAITSAHSTLLVFK